MDTDRWVAYIPNPPMTPEKALHPIVFRVDTSPVLFLMKPLLSSSAYVPSLRPFITSWYRRAGKRPDCNETNPSVRAITSNPWTGPLYVLTSLHLFQAKMVKTCPKWSTRKNIFLYIEQGPITHSFNVKKFYILRSL